MATVLARKEAAKETKKHLEWARQMLSNLIVDGMSMSRMPTVILQEIGPLHGLPMVVEEFSVEGTDKVGAQIRFRMTRTSAPPPEKSKAKRRK